MHVVVWSRRFDGERPMTEDEARELGVEPVRDGRDRAGADARRGGGALRHPQRAPGAQPETRGLVDAAMLARLKPGAMFINTARGEVVDYAALAAAVAESGLRVGLDVFAAEPAAATGAMSDPIVALPGVYGTHHIGASTDQAQEAIAAETVRIVRTYKETGQGAQRREPGAEDAGHAHARRPAPRSPGRPGARVRAPARGRINVQETENIDLRGRRGRRGAHQPRRRAAAGAAADDPDWQRRRSGFAVGDDLKPSGELASSGCEPRIYEEHAEVPLRELPFRG